MCLGCCAGQGQPQAFRQGRIDLLLPRRNVERVVDGR